MQNKPQLQGYLLAILAYLIWGLTPLFWKQLQHLPALQLLAYRIFWALVFIWLYMLVRKIKPNFALLKKEWLSVFTASLLLTANWFTYIYAVNSGYLQDASLGYYINPLVSIFLGMIFLKEKLHWAEWIALACAGAGVLFLTVHVGRFPWISLVLALSFGFYGLIKKRSAFPALPGLAMEVTLIFPFLLAFFFLGLDGARVLKQGVQNFSPVAALLLVFTGPLTIVPLVLFGQAVKKINLSAVGFLQFLAPTLMFIISVTLFKEFFPLDKLPGFLLVWIALGIYVVVRFRKG